MSDHRTYLVARLESARRVAEETGQIEATHALALELVATLELALGLLDKLEGARRAVK